MINVQELGMLGGNKDTMIIASKITRGLGMLGDNSQGISQSARCHQRSQCKSVSLLLSPWYLGLF